MIKEYVHLVFESNKVLNIEIDGEGNPAAETVNFKQSLKKSSSNPHFPKRIETEQAIVNHTCKSKL